MHSSTLKTLHILYFYIFVAILVFWSSTSFANCVTSKNAVFHSAPGNPNTAFKWDIPVNTPLRHLDTWKDWYQVQDYDGDVLWLHSSALGNKFFCALIKTETEAYDTYGFGNEAIGTLKKYTSFRFIQRKGEWTQGKNEFGELFWVLSNTVWVQ